MTRFRRPAITVVAVAVSLVVVLGPGSREAVARAVAGPGRAGWRLVYRSTSKTSNEVYRIAAVSPGDAWAVGGKAGAGNQLDQPLVLHWNGTRWRSAAVPGLAGYYLPGVAASGTQWVSTEPGSALACELDEFSRIPGKTTLWGAGAVQRTQTSALDSVICAYPKAP